MMQQLDETEQLDRQRQSDAWVEYVALLRKPRPLGTADAQRLLDLMALLAIDHATRKAHEQAVERLASLVQQRLSNDERATVAREGHERQFAATAAQRDYLAGLVQQLAPLVLADVFRSVDAALIVSQRGTPQANDHIARALAWKRLQSAAGTAELDAANQLRADDDTRAEIARVKDEFPQLFGRPAPAPKPASEPAKPREGQRRYIAAPGGPGWTQTPTEGAR